MSRRVILSEDEQKIHDNIVDYLSANCRNIKINGFAKSIGIDPSSLWKIVRRKSKKKNGEPTPLPKKYFEPATLEINRIKNL